MGLFNSKEIEKLKNENEELKTKFHFMYEKEQQAENLKKALTIIKKEISETNTSKNEIKSSLGELKLKLTEKVNEVEQINKLILELDKKKFELKEIVNSYGDEIKNVSNILGKKNDAADLDLSSIENANTADEIELFITNLKNNLINLKDDEIKFNKVVELKNLAIKDLENKSQKLVDEQQKIEEEISETKSRLNDLQSAENELKVKGQNLSSSYYELKNKKGELDALLVELETEIITKRELKDSLHLKALSLEEQITSQNDKLNETLELNKNLEEKESKSEKKLYEIDQTLDIKAKKLTSINTEIIHQEQKFNKIKFEIDKLISEKEKLETDLTENNSSLRNFNSKVEKLKELCSLLEMRRDEIEKGNLALENRFTTMFQRYNSELNKINKKRNLLEKIVLSKEKEVEARDQELFEKIASLEESENVLNMRQIEVESLEKYIETLKEKKDYLSNEIIVTKNEFDKHRKHKEVLKNEVQLLISNKDNIDRDLQNLVDVMVSSYNRSDERKKEIEKDIKLYDEQLDTYKEKINESMNELLEIQSSVSELKLEHEEYRNGISKLVKTKKKLHDDISKYQNVVQRYQNIKEKLKIEKAIAKNRAMPGPGPFKGNETTSNISLNKEAEKGRGSKLFKI